MKRVIRKTARELLELGNNLSRMGRLKGTSFNFNLLRTQKSLVKISQELNKLIKPTKEWEAYNTARVELCEVLCIKGEDKKPVLEMINGQQNYTFTDENRKSPKFDELAEEYKEAIEGRESQLKEYNDALELEMEADVFTFKEKDLPEGLDDTQVNILFELIELED